jgi:proteic killer suppression protein
MIKTFADQATADLFAGKRIARWANIQIVVTRKLQQLDSAATLESLRVPPGNRLEALTGNRKGQHSLRINEQWRLCFVWRADGVHGVEIVDYH